MNIVMPKKCPACAQDMHVRVLRCAACHTEVQGDFELGRFAQLSGGALAFLETFIRCRGNLKDVGAALGVSYPTARNRLDALIEALGFEDPGFAASRRIETLKKLKDGDLSVEQALAELEGRNYDE